MPCNIGYKSAAKVSIPVPVPEKFTAKVEAPKIDAELLKKMGEEDQPFVEWVEELEPPPLLEEALRRALLARGRA